MIKAIIVFNNLGRTRLLKFYEYISVENQQRIVKDFFQLISNKEENVCNFLSASITGFTDSKIVFRQYATLFFVFCIDSSESELAMLDLIQVFVETLDRCFESVCELDFVYHSDKVLYILNELIEGGIVLETNMSEILFRYEAQLAMESKECIPIAIRAASVVKNINIGHQLKEIKIADAIKDFKFNY